MPIRRGFVTIAAALVIMLVMSTSFITGVRFARQDASGAQNYVIAGTPVPTELQQPLSDLWQAYNHLNADSYWRPFANQKGLIYHAIEGMMLASSPPEDQHSIFLEPVQNQVVTGQLQEKSFGIGAQVQRTADKKGVAIVPLVGSPAAKAGLRNGDVIIAVNGEPLAKVSDDKAVALIRGPLNTVVRLTIVRVGTAQPFVVAVTRGTIPGVYDEVDGTVGYIKFSEFEVNTAQEVHTALVELLAKHVTGLILDLRDNGGGYVDPARDIASEFLPANAPIYWERANVGNGKSADTATIVMKSGVAQKLPVVVLVNGNTASAAEILTEALVENGRARVAGTTSYAKGSVQEDLPLADGSGLRITIRLWLTPKKHSVLGKGITPDFPVAAGTDASGNDLQKLRALQYLTTGK